MLLPVVWAACAVSACGTTTTLETRSGGVVEAHVLGGSPGSVYLSNKRSGHFTMRRDDIADADLPGNVMAFGGLALSAFGGWRLRVGDTRCGTFGDAGNCALNVLPSIVGFLAAVWGGYVWARAHHAFEDRSRPEPDQEHPPGWRKPDPFADPHP